MWSCWPLFCCIIFIHFPRFEHFLGNCESLYKARKFLLGKVFFPSESVAVISDMLACFLKCSHRETSSAPSYLSQTLICWEMTNSSARMEEQRDSSSGANLTIFSSVALPRLVLFVFSVGRLINHEYLMIACSCSDRAAGLMENINALNEVHLN